jgi:hypothetical protein
MGLFFVCENLEAAWCSLARRQPSNVRFIPFKVTKIETQTQANGFQDYKESRIIKLSANILNVWATSHV